MILSASRRTDIPGFYSDWFMNRMAAGFALVPHPRTGVMKRVDLTQAEGIVFWSKNPAPMIRHLSVLKEKNIPFYFTVTLTAYPTRVEAHLPAVKDRLESLTRLVAEAGPHSLVWRYDPIIFAPGLRTETHVSNFEKLAARMEGLTDTCVISFLDFYQKLSGPLKALGAREPSPDETRFLTTHLLTIGRRHGIAVMACTEDPGLLAIGVEAARCIDEERLSLISGRMLYRKRESGQRPGCFCAESVELGVYDTCPHGCVYCYANQTFSLAPKRLAAHKPEAPALWAPETLELSP